MDCGLLSLLVRTAHQAAQGPCQWQPPQVRAPQIRSAQVQSYPRALGFIVPVYRATSALVRRQQPFDVAAPEHQASERVDTATDAGDYLTSGGKLLLPRLVYLRLSAPALSTRAPVGTPRRPTRPCRAQRFINCSADLRLGALLYAY